MHKNMGAILYGNTDSDDHVAPTLRLHTNTG